MPEKDPGKRVRCRAIRDGSRWRWLVWLDPAGAPITRHWRDRCMEPGADSQYVGLYDTWEVALETAARTRADAGPLGHEAARAR